MALSTPSQAKVQKTLNYRDFKILTLTERKVLVEVMVNAFRYNYNRIAQGTIAKKLGLARETVSRIIGRLVRKGFLTKRNYFNAPCRYFIPQEYFHKRLLFWLKAQIKKVGVLTCVTLLVFKHPKGFIKNTEELLNVNTSTDSKREFLNKIRTGLKNWYGSEVKKEKKVYKCLQNVTGLSQTDIALLMEHPEDAVRYAVGILKSKKDIQRPYHYLQGVIKQKALKQSPRQAPLASSTQNSPQQEQQSIRAKVERDPVEEYHRVEAFKDTPKYKQVVSLVGEHAMPNPFINVLQRLNLSLEIDAAKLRKIKMQEIAAHVGGSQECEFSVSGKPCAFAPLAQDIEYITNLYREAQDDAQTVPG